ncbi:ATP-binding protein [Methylorubrum sp. SL192]|uniref:ATP-binding protein n=1 Tax=Methylorubrum sp. SL192 TaxID=2995167 RepID=UPI002272F514|nr:ATP-binding protein [Methylorubrum sp. SL192]MCY1642004.1 ATP-binding protein [Methylorubrum sp. SL192]
MDVVRNPYAPGAGTPPPELAGRTDLIQEGTIAIQRMAAGRPTQSIIMVGLRGVGKTVLLNRFEEMATESGCRVSLVEAHEGKGLPELLAPHLRSILYSLSHVQNAKDLARRGLRGLKGFLNGLRVNISDIDFGLSIDAEEGLADSGNIEADFPELIVAVAQAAKAASKPVALLIDELQYLSEKEFSALIMGVHKVNQKNLPLIVIGAGLPQIRALAGNSKSYAERLFRFPDIGALKTLDAVEAIQQPAMSEGARFDDRAIAHILAITERYPYFLQQWGYVAWNISQTNVITEETARRADALAIAELDKSFFQMRFERCTPSEKRYMRALAEFGAGKQRSGEIADLLGVKVQSVAPTRSALIKKGMIYSPAHGDTEFTVPLFDQYMRRAIPIFGAGRV